MLYIYIYALFSNNSILYLRRYGSNFSSVTSYFSAMDLNTLSP